MVIYTDSRQVSVAANQRDVEIYSVIPADDETITILEIGYTGVSDGYIRAYIGEVKVDDLICAVMPDVNHRTVVKRELKPAQPFRVKVDSVTAGDFGVYIVYDKVKV